MKKKHNKSKSLNIIINNYKNYNGFTKAFQKLDRKKVFIRHSEHLIKDKNLSLEELEFVVETVRSGKLVYNKSSIKKGRVCFKKYSKDSNRTYFVIAKVLSNSIKTITAFYKKGKY